MIKYLHKPRLQARLGRYRQQAEAILANARHMEKMPDQVLSRSFNSLYGKPTRENMLIAFSIIAQMIERTLGVHPYPVQIMGALAMADGAIVEMATGEGKTLTAAFPLAWHGLHGKAHAMTANDYLAKRDADLMVPLFEALELSASYLQADMGSASRSMAYQSCIVYGTPSQFVFDYLRNHTAYSPEEQFHNGFHFALIDEADSILIDEARTPFILSGPAEATDLMLPSIMHCITGLTACQVGQDERTQLERLVIHHDEMDADICVSLVDQSVSLTEEGIAKVELYLTREGLIKEGADIWKPEHDAIWRTVQACLKACHLYHRDQHYLVRDDRIVYIDPESGRPAAERRWSDGVHQALEAKEGVSIRPESRDIGRISLANYISHYAQVAGMTGTALLEAEQIKDLYNITVVPIPTNKPCIREDMADVVFMTEQAKMDHIVRDIERIHGTGQPILVGTSSVEASDLVSERLMEKGLAHRVLNARQDENEAFIISQAGRLGAITIATSMAGRGTDIILGGASDGAQVSETEREKVIEKGGLFVIGCERLDCARLDRQLAGRAGRQGDPGSSRFYVSLDDPLLRDYGGPTMSALFRRLGAREEEGLTHPMINRAIAKAQARKQAMYVAIRKQGIRQDSVIDRPRSVFYELRNTIMACDDDDIVAALAERAESAADQLLSAYQITARTDEHSQEFADLQSKLSQWGLFESHNLKLFRDYVASRLGFDYYRRALAEWIRFDIVQRSAQLDTDRNLIIKQALLAAVDRQWYLLLDESEQIRKGIHLRAYAQQKPDLAFKNEVFKMFRALYEDLPVVMLDVLYTAIEKHETGASQGMDAA